MMVCNATIFPEQVPCIRYYLFYYIPFTIRHYSGNDLNVNVLNNIILIFRIFILLLLFIIRAVVTIST